MELAFPCYAFSYPSMRSGFIGKSRVVALVLIFGLSALATCRVSADSSTSVSRRTTYVKPRQASVPDSCGFVGSTDIYGIGIRIGYYAQALSTWIANFFVLSEAKSLRTVNTLFIFAMFIGLIFMSTTPSQTHAVEGYIMIQTIFVVWYVGATDVSRFSIKFWKFDFERALIRNGSIFGMVVYNVWYWWEGLDVMQRTPCGTFGFFFSKVTLYGWYRSANMVLCIIAVCFETHLVFFHFFRALQHFLCRKINSAEYQSRLASKIQKELHHASASASCSGRAYNGPPYLDSSDQGTVALHTTALDTSVESPQHLVHSPTRRSLRTWPVSTAPRSPISITTLSAIPPSPNIDSSVGSSHSNVPALHTTQLKSSVDDDLPSFEQLYVADDYISTVLSATPTSMTKQNRFEFTLLQGTLRVYIPYIRPSIGNGVSFGECCHTVVAVIRQRQFNTKVVAVLFSHINALRQQPMFRYPWLLHSALTASSHAHQDWRTLATMANIRIVRLPETARKWYWIPAALQTGIVTVGLVLSVELTLRWNHIQGVNQFGTVGQLIPFVLGVSGLIKVLWAWLQVSLRRDGTKVTEDLGETPEVRLANAYYRRKEAYKKSTVAGSREGSDGGNIV